MAYGLLKIYIKIFFSPEEVGKYELPPPPP
jgi:hypothetical protein